jgi:N utilization substance protein B
MISRRLVRIKTLQALYSWQQGEDKRPGIYRAELQKTLHRTYDVYLFLLELPHYLNEYLISEQEAEKSKYYPDKNRIRTLGLLNHCDLSRALFDNTLNKKRSLFQVSWPNLGESFPSIVQGIFEQDFVRDFLIFDNPDFAQQKEFLITLYNYLIAENESFFQTMEDVYACWQDDEESLLRELHKTLESCRETGEVPLAQPIQEEDELMALQLFDLVVENSEAYEKRVSEVTDNWDPGRIAILDLLCIKLALAEFKGFSHIPVKVSINEYLDIVKEYSTPGSSRFLNGVLDRLRISMEKSGEILKSGRGLREK